jgi:hypothetical protein
MCCFDALCDACLFGNLQKCAFCSNRVYFLCYVVTSHGIEVDPARLKQFRIVPSLRRKRKCGVFLALLDFRRIAEDFGSISMPLNELTKKDMPFV